MNNNSKFSTSKLFWQIAVIMGFVILITNPIAPLTKMLGMTYHPSTPFVATVVEANEIYEMFTCPCCGQLLRKEEQCCGSMTQMVDFIDQRIATGSNKDDIVAATVLEFGIDRLANESDQTALRERLIANAPKDAPRINLIDTKKDLGIVTAQGGTKTTEFIIKNEGKSELIIDKLSSSCDCTSGSIIYQGVEGPRFFMAGHGYDEPETDWRVAIAPGDEAVVKVYYDPTVHLDLEGPVTRTLSIHSNDPVDFESKVLITLEQKR
jgi:hypothetical protein